MTDIFDIKPNVLPFLFDIKYSLLYGIFLVIIGFYFFYKKKKVPDIEIEHVDFQEEKIDFQYVLQSIEKHHLESSKEIFYQKMKALIILYLEHKTQSHISQMTLKELNNLGFSQEVKEVFQDIYFKQYSQYSQDDNYVKRMALIQKFKNILI